MANVGKLIKDALGDLVDGNVWMDNCPKEESLSEWIVYYSMYSAPNDHGDDMDTSWLEMMAVHWVKRGNVNYYEMRKILRNRLRKAGFSLGQTQSYFDDETKTTRVIIPCSIVEDYDFNDDTDVEEETEESDS